MSHQCVHCGRICPTGSRELIEGCDGCGSRFFFYLKKEPLENEKTGESPIELSESEKIRMEKEVREMAGIPKDDPPIILDVEAIRVIGPGKYEIDVVNAFNDERPTIYKLSEGRYVIDLASTLKKRQ